MEIKKAEFLVSASKFMECPKLNVPEVALIWRSNVWKSSLINMLTWVNWLAKSSNKPWKTQLLNYFMIDDNWCLVDLPWYWYAKTGVQNKIWWMDMMQRYFTQRRWLKRVFVLIDGNVPPQQIDLEFMSTLQNDQVLFDLIITKIDKVKQKDLNIFLKDLKQELALRIQIDVNVFLISNVKKIWKLELLNYINTLIN